MRKISRGLLVLGILLLLPRAVLPQESYPVLHMRRGNVDAQALIEQLAPEGTDIDAVLRGKQTIDGYGDDIDGQYAHRDIYVLKDMTVFIQEPSGEIHVEWDSPVKAEYDAIESEQREKYDPDYDYMLDDGQTPFYTTAWENVPSGGESERINDFAREFADQLGIQLLSDPVLVKICRYTYPDGQILEKGYARYAILRNDLPVETTAYWSEISAAGYYMEGEALSIEWYENEVVVAANLTMYACESEEAVSEGLISLDEAREAVGSELERRIADEGREPVADLCYMPTPDLKGQLYAEFVPAWRFRFRGEDGNTHRVNALTGQVIR